MESALKPTRLLLKQFNEEGTRVFTTVKNDKIYIIKKRIIISTRCLLTYPSYATKECDHEYFVREKTSDSGEKRETLT